MTTKVLSKADYYQSIARTVAYRGNCVGRVVGAIAVLEDRIVATGYNGVAQGLKNCLDGGCTRCSDRANYASGVGYDLCICVHAEANTIAMAARSGIALRGATLYTTDQPCFGCAKELLQTGISQVVYERPWNPNPQMKADYVLLQKALKATKRTPKNLPVELPPKHMGS